MNARRVARLHRQLAAIHGALADALLEGEPEAPPDPSPRRRRPLPVPTAEDIELGRKLLRRAGVEPAPGK